MRKIELTSVVSFALIYVIAPANGNSVSTRASSDAVSHSKTIAGNPNSASSSSRTPANSGSLTSPDNSGPPSEKDNTTPPLREAPATPDSSAHPAAPESGSTQSGTLDTNSSKSQSTAAKPQSRWRNFPVKVFAAVTGAVFGTPVCAVRKPYDEEKYGINQLAGEKPKPRVSIPSGVFWAPFAAVSGLLESPFYALNNSLDNFDKPFSAVQFSCGKEKSISPNLRYGGETYK